MYIDVPQTPQAVVACVIVFNAAFGYSWGPLPWLYPPEVGKFEVSYLLPTLMVWFTDHATDVPRERGLDVYCHKLGI